MARPNKYDTYVAPRLSEIEDWVRNGATDEEVAERLGISERTFYKYKNEFSQFSQVLKKARGSGRPSRERITAKSSCGRYYGANFLAEEPPPETVAR